MSTIRGSVNPVIATYSDAMIPTKMRVAFFRSRPKGFESGFIVVEHCLCRGENNDDARLTDIDRTARICLDVQPTNCSLMARRIENKLKGSSSRERHKMRLSRIGGYMTTASAIRGNMNDHPDHPPPKPQPCLHLSWTAPGSQGV